MTDDGKKGLRELIGDLLAYPLPRGVGWPQVMGSLLLTCFTVQVVTGILLALYYSPSASQAWESVRYIEREVQAGSLVRGVHHFTSSAFVILLGVHIARVFLWGAYKKRRRWTWVAGCLLLFCVLGFGFTGYLLPWDLKAYFGTRVGVEIAGSAPLLGDAVKRLLAGGPSVDELTLPRFYALHSVVLPLTTVLLIAWHLTLLRVHGIARSWKHPREDTGRLFYPHQLAKDLACGLVLVLVLIALGWGLGAPLEDKADPQNTTYVPRPEWYFLGLQQLLRIFQGDLEILGSVVIPTAAGALLLLTPWIDRNPERAPSKRPLAMAVGLVFVLSTIGLTVWGRQGIRAEERAMAARIAAAADVEELPPRPAPLDDSGLIARGQLLTGALRCTICHGDYEVMPDGAPSLLLMGSMVQRDWLAGYLREPYRIRFETENTHPLMRMPDFQLEDVEIDALVAYVTSLRSEERVPDRGFDDSPTTAEVDEGMRLFEDFDCRSCHRLDGDGEEIGPHLDGAGRRLNPSYAYALIKDPEGMIPGTSMTDFLMSDEEARALVRFLQTLE